MLYAIATAIPTAIPIPIPGPYSIPLDPIHLMFCEIIFHSQEKKEKSEQ